MGGSVEEVATEDLMKKYVLKRGEDTAEVYSLGACATSYVKDGYDYLYVRPDAKMDGSKPISGGCPFCWPQFGPGDIQQHGFARNKEWTLSGKNDDSDDPSVTFTLRDDADTMTMWPHQFELTYTVKLSSGSLDTTFTVKNTGSDTLSFQHALHSYLRTGDIDSTIVKGPFEGKEYLDKTQDPQVMVKHGADEVTIGKEIDSVFKGVTGDLSIRDPVSEKLLVVSNKSGYADTVVWNPYGAESMGYKNFVCVESANVFNKIELEAGKEWTAEVSLVPGSLA